MLPQLCGGHLAAAPLTEFEANQIIEAPKSIEATVRWASSEDGPWLNARVPILNRLGLRLELIASRNRALPQRFSIVLLARNAFRIRGLCYDTPHKNAHRNDTSYVPGPHLHVWTDLCRDRLATPITGISGKLEEAIPEFCAICNIDLRGGVNEIPAYQPDLGV